MAINNFNPTLWSNELLVNLQKSLVYGNVVNRDYEGVISGQGSAVKINNITDVTVAAYTKNSTTISPEVLTDATQTLSIDQANYFAFKVDDIDAAQQNPKIMVGAMQQAGYNLADVADKYIAGLYTGVATANAIGNDTTPIDVTAANVYAQMVALSVKLDEANVPNVGRFVVVPSWIHALILQDDKFVKGPGLAEDVRSRGAVAEVAGLAVYKSNNVPNTAGEKYKIIAGYPGAITFADQISKVQTYESQTAFAEVVRGLHVFGAKLVRPTGIAVLTADKA